MSTAYVEKNHEGYSQEQSKKAIKVKVYYAFRGSDSTRMTVFTTSVENTTSDNDPTIVLVPLRQCLWAICSSSPDMICQEHDLSIYAANFRESCSTLNDRRRPFIWEGHGLLSWIMESSDNSGDILIHGKAVSAKDSSSSSTDHAEAYIELQPTLKWPKDEFYRALGAQNFDCFKDLPRSPPQSQSCSCGINAALQKRYASDWLSSSEKRFPVQQQRLLSGKGDDTEFDRYLHQKRHETSPKLPSLASLSPPSAGSIPRLPPPSTLSLSSDKLFRPEPIFPSPSSGDYKRPRLSPPASLAMEPPARLQPIHITGNSGNNDEQFVHRRRVTDGYALETPSAVDRSGVVPTYNDPYPATYDLLRHGANNEVATEQRKSAFKPTMMEHQQQQQQRELQTNSAIPVVYTPSNKKRRKNPPLLMPAAGPEKTNTASVPQQVSTTIRTYYEVDRDENGNYILPVEIDSWTVVNLGTVVYDRPAYHNQRYIYPVNYTVRKWYRSMVDPKSDTQYTCRILDNGKEPKFEVTADDYPTTFSGPTPTTVWTIIVRRAFAIRNQEYGHNPVGPDFFGLRKNTIAKMIQDLPNADKCSQYVWQTFEPARFNKPGRNRRRTDPTLPGSLFGGVNYSLTTGRLLPHINHATLQRQKQQEQEQEQGQTSSPVSSPPMQRYLPSPAALSSPTGITSAEEMVPRGPPTPTSASSAIKTA